MKVNTLKLVVVAVLAQTALMGCEQDYSLKLTSKPLVTVDPAIPVIPGNPTTSPTPEVRPSPVVVTSPTPSIPSAAAASDEFNVPAVQAPKVDILMVIDNSGSMENDQNTLISSFSSFISAFTASNADYHIGIISTDSLSYYNVPITNTSNPYFGFLNPFPTATSTAGTLLTKYTGIPFLTNSTPDVTAKFANNAKLGIKGSGEERCTYSALEALSASKLANENAGFRRSDALMSVMCFSDENEQIKSDAVSVGGQLVATETTPAQRISRYLARMAELCPAGSACPGFRTDLVVDLNAASKAVTYPLSSSVVNSYPDYYLKLKAAAPQTTNTLNIGSSTWGSSLASIGGAIASQAKQYRLAHKKVIQSSVQVSIVSGTRSEALASNQYSYIADNASDPSSLPAIDLPAATMALVAGKKIVVSYQYYP